ncbi:MAG: hypothetical protein IKP17_05500 [Oscillospiraceae bacterium]|nr:hypothetical protein [Oscillospiraceae bacterium]MBR4692194.1 hypothetical protein [Oscillospiraceae bacterium]
MGKGKAVRSVVFILLFAALLLVPVFTFNRETGVVSTAENRVLADFPALRDASGKLRGEALAGINDWLSDHIGLRDVFLDAYVGVKYRLLGVATTDRVHLGKKGWVFLTANQNIEIGTGSELLGEEELRRIAERQQTLAGEYAAQGVSYVLLLTPSKASVYPEYLSVGGGETGYTVCDQLSEYLRANTDVTVINAKESLLAAKESGQLYYKTDTHWTQYGSFVACRQILEELAARGVVSAGRLPEISFSPQEYRGDLYDMIGAARLLPPETAPFAETWDSSVREAAAGEEYESLKSVCEPYETTTTLPVLLKNDGTGAEGTLLIYGDSQMMMNRLLPRYLAECFAETDSLRIRQTEERIDREVRPDAVLFQCSERLIRDVLLPPEEAASADLPVLPSGGTQSRPDVGWIGFHGILPKCGSETADETRSLRAFGGRAVTLTGWAADFLREAPLGGLYLEIGGEVFACAYGSEWKGVAEHFGIPGLTDAVGFTVSFPSELLDPSGRTEIRFHMVSADGSLLYAPETFFLISEEREDGPSETDLGKQHDTGFGWIGDGGILAKFGGVSPDGSGAVAVEAGRDLEITGWAADFMAAAPLSALYLRIGDRELPCEYGLSRPDVAEHFGCEALENVGFSVTLPASLLPASGETAVEFIMVSADGRGHYAPVRCTLQVRG